MRTEIGKYDGKKYKIGGVDLPSSTHEAKSSPDNLAVMLVFLEAQTGESPV
jgi:hypothetical protein